MNTDEPVAFASGLCASVFLSCFIFCSTVRGTDSPYGINGCAWSHLGMNTEHFDREAGIKRLRTERRGAHWDRCDFWWGRIEPEKGRFFWRDVDWVVQQYRDAGIEVMPILCYASAWSDGAAPTTDEER